MNIKVIEVVHELNNGQQRVEKVIDEETQKRYIRKQGVTQWGKDLLKVEYAAQKYFNQICDNKNTFLFQDVSFFDEQLLIPDLTQEYPEGVWIAQNEEDAHRNNFEMYKHEYLSFISICNSIKFEELPQELQESGKLRNQEYLREKFTVDASYLVTRQIISQEESDILLKRAIEASLHRGLAHHDVVPWHMYKTSQGIFLIDAGWATWSLSGYDVAYTTLQLIGYSNNQQDAHDLYSSCIAQLNITDISRDVKNAMAYRGVRLAAELHKKNISQYQDVIKTALNG